ncbi:CMRF35-like molecule 1 isoform 1-T1 [Clarias gariepinus]
MLGMKFYVCSWLFFAVQKEISAILRLNGKENEQLTFTCSHSWAVTNVKYICRLGCSDKDILIRSVGVGIIAKKERYSLYDRGRGLFTITINRLKKSDAGKYWCGIERTGFDTYQEVNIRILDAPQVTETPSTQTTVMTHVKGRNSYIPVCVFGLLIILILMCLALQYSQARTSHVVTDCLSVLISHTPGRGTGNNRVNQSSSVDQNPTTVNPVYVNIDFNLKHENVYQTLRIKATQLDSLYETLSSGTEQSDQ